MNFSSRLTTFQVAGARDRTTDRWNARPALDPLYHERLALKIYVHPVLGHAFFWSGKNLHEPSHLLTKLYKKNPHELSNKYIKSA